MAENRFSAIYVHICKLQCSGIDGLAKHYSVAISDGSLELHEALLNLAGLHCSRPTRFYRTWILEAEPSFSAFTSTTILFST